jgi:hypothetical protein
MEGRYPARRFLRRPGHTNDFETFTFQQFLQPPTNQFVVIEDEHADGLRRDACRAGFLKTIHGFLSGGGGTAHADL